MLAVTLRLIHRNRYWSNYSRNIWAPSHIWTKYFTALSCYSMPAGGRGHLAAEWRHLEESSWTMPHLSLWGRPETLNSRLVFVDNKSMSGNKSYFWEKDMSWLSWLHDIAPSFIAFEQNNITFKFSKFLTRFMFWTRHYP